MFPSPTRRFPIWALGLALSLLAATPSLAANDEDVVTRSFSLANGAQLSLSNINGDVRLVAWDGDEVRVEATKKARALTSARVSEILRETKIVFEESVRGLDVKTESPKDGWMGWFNRGDVSVTYDVKVPRSVFAKARTVNGNVVVEAVTGGVDARSTNGRIVITGAQGQISAHTTNGAVRAELDSVDESVELSSTNGGIRLYLPAGVNADFSARTVNGRVRADTPIRIESSSRRGNRLSGTLGSGGAPIDLKTVNGSISVESE